MKKDKDKDKDKDKENHEGDVSYTTTTKRKSEKIQQTEGRSIDIESNNQEEEDIKEKIIDRMVDRNYNTYNKTEHGKTEFCFVPCSVLLYVL